MLISSKNTFTETRRKILTKHLASYDPVKFTYKITHHRCIYKLVAWGFEGILELHCVLELPCVLIMEVVSKNIHVLKAKELYTKIKIESILLYDNLKSKSKKKY